MALNLFVLGGSEQVDERLQEAGFDDRGFVERVDGDVPDAGDRGEDEREVGGVEKLYERSEPVGPDDIELVFLVRSEVPERKSSLALHLWRRRIHEVDQRLDEPLLGLG